MTSLRSAVQEYLIVRRSLGFRLDAAGRLLLKFVAFMEAHRASVVTTALARAWAQQSPTVQPSEWARRLSIVRTFARYHQATDSRTEVPPDGLLPYRPKRARPYQYSDAEIRALLRAARHMPCRYERGRLRPWVYSCLWGLLSVSGLRLGEARNLELGDVDLKAGVLTIRGAKFGTTRLVPLHSSTCRVLADYLVSVAKRTKMACLRPPTARGTRR
jgi:integrase/recombinase XerD